MEMVALWTQLPQAPIDSIRMAFRAGVETGDLAIACFSCNHTITDLLTRAAGSCKEVSIAVSDHGPGLPAEEKYFRRACLLLRVGICDERIAQYRIRASCPEKSSQYGLADHPINVLLSLWRR
jgi:hypothetical protein